MTIEDLLSQIGGYGIEGFGTGNFGLSDITGIGSEGIASAMNTMFGLEEEEDFLNPAMFQGISPLSLSQTFGKSFSPLIETGGQKYLQDLISQQGGQKAKTAGGGFAGSGQQQQYQQAARDVYGKGMSGVLSTAGKSRTQGIQNVSDIVTSWRDLASQIAG
jgi:hypothetical protein